MNKEQTHARKQSAFESKSNSWENGDQSQPQQPVMETLITYE